MINWRGMVLGFTEILDGVVRIVSLGHCHPNLSFRWICYRTLKDLNAYE